MRQGCRRFEAIEDIKETFQKVGNNFPGKREENYRAMLRAYLRFVIIMLNRNWKDDCSLKHRMAFMVWLLLLFGLVPSPP